jgi:hypothetical protein
MRLRSVLLAAVIALLPGRAAADYAFVFGDSSGNLGVSNFNVAVGSTVNVLVYLEQTNGTTGLSNPGQGLKDGGVGLTFNQAIANVPSTGAITANPAFDTSSKSVGTGTANLNVFQTSSAPVLAPTSGPTANAILIGSFTFTGVSAGTTATVTTLPHPDPPFANNVLGDGTDIDSLIANSSAVITVTAVPEPGSMILTGLAVAGFGAGVLRRRLRRQQTEPAPSAAE